MPSTGILAYGSLIDDPGVEIEPLIAERRAGIVTPFCIEFARSSSIRNNAPTVVPVENGGSQVQATILVLAAGVTLNEAEDMLWRRETRNEKTGKNYVPPLAHSKNKVIVDRLCDYNGIDIVLYTRIDSNITDNNPTTLAELAISSAKACAGKIKQDGISYLISLKNNSISTPLMPMYEAKILRICKAQSLIEAYEKCRI